MTSRDQVLIEVAWQLAREVECLEDEERDRLRPLVDQLAEIVNANATVVDLRVVRGAQ